MLISAEVETYNKIYPHGDIDIVNRDKDGISLVCLRLSREEAVSLMETFGDNSVLDGTL